MQVLQPCQAFRAIPVVSLLAAVAFLGVPASAQTSLFRHVGAVADGAAGSKRAKRSQAVTLDLGLLSRAAADRLPAAGGSAGAPVSIALNLFPDKTFHAVMDRVEYSRDKTIAIWFGHVPGANPGSLIMAVNGSIAVGNLKFEKGGFFALRYSGSADLHFVQEMDEDAFPPELPPRIPNVPQGGEPQLPPAAADAGDVIDVMVVYTPAARAAAGGTAAMEALIQTGAAETNQGYANSNIVQRINVVHTHEVLYFEQSTGAFEAALDDITTGGLNSIVVPLRNLYHADLVSMWIESNEYCGLAWLMSTVSSAFESSGYSVVARNCATGYYSFAHEMGHNEGAHHDRANATGAGAYPFSYGYQQTQANPPFRTVMAYNCSQGCTRINYWSNPGVSTSISGPTYPSGTSSADNHTTLNNTRSVVASFRLAPDLKVAISRSGNLYRGQTASYSIQVSNGGGAASAGLVSASVVLPAGLTATGMSGSGWVCTFPGGPCTRSDSLAAGSSYPAITLTASVSSSAPATLTVSTAAAGGGETYLGNDSAVDTATIAAPTADSVTPASGSGLTQTFAATYSDTNGYAETADARILISSDGGSVHACQVRFTSATKQFFLLDDAGATWSPPVTTGTVENSQCILNGAASSGAGAGNTLTLTVALSFKAGFAGTKSILLYAEDPGGANTGLVNRGTWVVPITNVAPVVVSMSPVSSSGARQAFTAVYSDTNGFGDIVFAQILFSSSGAAAQSCMLHYYRATNQLFLLNDAGAAWLTPIVPGSGTAVNSQCSVAGTGYTAAASGNTVTLTITIDFNQSFQGVKKVFQYVQDAAGANSGYKLAGSWTVPANAAPTVVSVSPSTGVGTTQTFTATYSDANGYADLKTTQLFFTGNGSATASCFIHYNRPSNQLFLLNDAGSGWLNPVSPGSGTLSNSQCTVSPATIATSADTLTLTLAVQFTPGFTGLKAIFMYAEDTAGGNSSYQLKGSWTIPTFGNVAPTADFITPSGGSSSGGSLFTLSFSDANGYADLRSMMLLVTPDGRSANTCLVSYYRPANQLLLMNDAATAWLAPINMGSGTLTNSQCSIRGDLSSVSGSGNTLTVRLYVEFNAATFGGFKSIYMYAEDLSSANSGFVTKGSWTVN